MIAKLIHWIRFGRTTELLSEAERQRLDTAIHNLSLPAPVDPHRLEIVHEPSFITSGEYATLKGFGPELDGQTVRMFHESNRN